MSVVNPGNTPADSWDYIPSLPRPLQASKVQVPDDWDAEEEDEEEPQRLWENANTKAPMPALVISSSSSGTSTAPPPAAFQPSLRILKRPSASPSSSSASSSDAQQKTYAEREAQYQAARERIFGRGSTTPPQATASDRSRKIANHSLAPNSEGSTPPSSTVIRNPRGPDSTPHDTPRTRGPESGSSNGRGFVNRRGARRKGSSGREPDSKTPPG